ELWSDDPAPPCSPAPSADNNVWAPQGDDGGFLTIARRSLVSPKWPALKSAVSYLANLARFRGLGATDINEWAPRPEDLENIQFALERREAEWLRSAVVTSLHPQALNGAP